MISEFKTLKSWKKNLKHPKMIAINDTQNDTTKGEHWFCLSAHNISDVFSWKSGQVEPQMKPQSQWYGCYVEPKTFQFFKFTEGGRNEKIWVGPKVAFPSTNFVPSKKGSQNENPQIKKCKQKLGQIKVKFRSQNHLMTQVQSSAPFRKMITELTKQFG